ncbi:diguanylate cyclase (GGDEF) domain-containing protein [Quadrisphaera granulorum]|uniref:Diguanylate cyclase (GGDEF)-like protein n=1 Tax=Quadrisphaera granulorum TaxID=317664 RepID=A0A316ARP1_9ACTN|nr:GGDEF domain-containing protein [Quadrisphaera granulorum]PWJ52767.1 diguanylate cyclase (GGDEF)-like protein [Quadrisphaera granulorum]SZE97372.1 diguanylate cyclase (GGDEF) domain-containing protein [Quadrisphaera granulorum]
MPLPRALRTSRFRTVLRTLASALTAPALAVCFGALTERLGVQTRLGAAVTVALVLAASGTPWLRGRLERLTTSTGGVALNVTYLALLAALLAPLGLTALVPTACTMVAIHAVVIRPTRRRTLAVMASVVGVSAASMGAQWLGIVDGLLPAGATAVVAAGTLLFCLPTLGIASRLSRQTLRAAEALEAERQVHVAELEGLALLDPLTGLLSRRGLAAPLGRAATDASPHRRSALLFLDLDGFKPVNDVHGHAAGDALLVVVAERLLASVRPADCVGRTGGDEFVIVLEGIAADDEAHAVAERVRGEVPLPVLLPDGSSVSVGASVGVAVVDHPVSTEELLAAADAAMYEMKRASRSRRNAPHDGAQDDAHDGAQGNTREPLL